jgi:hypothetical protein
MEYKVYELFDQEDTIVYVGHSIRPAERFYSHTIAKPLYPGRGKFYGRTDLSWRIHSIWPNKKSAWKAEGARKLELGLDWIEQTVIFQNGKNHGGDHCLTIHTCPYCNKIGKGNSMKRWHFTNCKLNPLKSS